MSAQKAICTVGRRKTAIARVRLVQGKGKVMINGKELADYFPTPGLQYPICAAQKIVKVDDKVDLSILVHGSGLNSQAEACRLGIARALQMQNNEFRTPLKKAGYLRRDSRMVERKKYGLRKARRGTQFSKR